MNNMTLFEISSEYNQALAGLYEMEQDGAIDEQTFLDTMESLEGELTEKAKRVGAYIRNTKAMAEQIKQAEADMAKRRKSLEKHASGLTDYLLRNMLDSGISEINSPWFDLKVKKTPPSVIVTDDADIPLDLMMVKTTTAPNKTAIKKAIQDGLELEGVELRQGHRLEIK